MNPLMPRVEKVEPLFLSYRDWSKQNPQGKRQDYDAYLAEEQDRFDRLKPDAEELFLSLVDELSKTGGNRMAVDQIREALRNNEKFVELSDILERMAGSSSHWMNAVIRVECKRAFRSRGELLARLRAERAEAIRQEALAEKALLDENPIFGMF